MGTINLVEYFELREKIIKNYFLIHVLHAILTPEVVIELITTSLPKVTTLMAICTPDKILKIGIKENNDEHWTLEYDLSAFDIHDIAAELYSKHPIYSTDVDFVFSTRKMPKDFMIYLEQQACSAKWKYGFERKYETNKNMNHTVDYTEIEKYKKNLSKTLKKYEVLSKVLLKLFEVGYYTCSNTGESFRISYLENHKIRIQYNNFTQDYLTVRFIPAQELEPSNLDKIPIPLLHLALIV